MARPFWAKSQFLLQKKTKTREKEKTGTEQGSVSNLRPEI